MERHRAVLRSAVIGAVIVLHASCAGTESATEDHVLRYFGPGGVAADLVRLYEQSIPGTGFSTDTEYTGSLSALGLLERDEADVTFAASGTTFAAYSSGTEFHPEPHHNLRGLAVMRMGVLHVLVDTDTVDFHDLRDLSDARVAVGPAWGSSAAAAREQLDAFGIDEHQLHALPLEETPAAFSEGRIDALFVILPIPASIIARSLTVPGVRIVGLGADDIGALRNDQLFFRPASIPEGTYSHHPTLESVGMERVLVGRADIPEDIVFAMLEVLFDAMPELSVQQPSLSGVRLDRAAGTPIPLHPGAARFYRERQLFR